MTSLMRAIDELEALTSYHAAEIRGLTHEVDDVVRELDTIAEALASLRMDLDGYAQGQRLLSARLLKLETDRAPARS